MKHEDAWTRLPDLLDDRDDAALLAHVGGCADCQRQLFLLGRVDRLLRDSASERRGRRRLRAPRIPASAAAVAVAAAVAAVVLTLGVFRHGSNHELMFRTASGQAVGHAVMRHSDARNVSLGLTARALPVDHGQVFVLWADDGTRSPMAVGRFMVDRRGACRVRFNLPATHTWARFWITRPANPGAIIAST
jgi:hypothetical protein